MHVIQLVVFFQKNIKILNIEMIVLEAEKNYKWWRVQRHHSKKTNICSPTENFNGFQTCINYQ